MSRIPLEWDCKLDAAQQALYQVRWEKLVPENILPSLTLSLPLTFYP